MNETVLAMLSLSQSACHGNVENLSFACHGWWWWHLCLTLKLRTLFFTGHGIIPFYSFWVRVYHFTPYGSGYHTILLLMSMGIIPFYSLWVKVPYHFTSYGTVYNEINDKSGSDIHKARLHVKTSSWRSSLLHDNFPLDSEFFAVPWQPRHALPCCYIQTYNKPNPEFAATIHRDPLATWSVSLVGGLSVFGVRATCLRCEG